MSARSANLDAENAVIGCALYDPEGAVGQVAHDLTPQHFSPGINRDIYTAICDLHTAGTATDIVTVIGQLHRQGAVAVTEDHLAQRYARVADQLDAARIKRYAGDVIAAAKWRDLEDLAKGIYSDVGDTRLTYQEVRERAQRAVLSASTDDNTRPLADGRALMDGAWEMLEQLRTSDGGLLGLSSGYQELDKYTSGFQAGLFYVLAARPAVGKTALALQIAANIACKGARVLVASLEMDHKRLGMRLLCARARIDPDRYAKDSCRPHEIDRAKKAASEIAASGLYIDHQPAMTLEALKLRAREMHMRGGLDFIVADYIQILEILEGARHETRALEVGEIARGLKALALELGVPVLGLAQVNREVEKRVNKRPMLGDMAESAKIDHNADVVIGIYRDDYYDPHSERAGIAELIFLKNRNGPTGTAELAFLPRFTSFEHLSPKAVPPSETKFEVYEGGAR